MTITRCLRPIKVIAHGQKADKKATVEFAQCAENCTTVASDGPDFHRYRRVREPTIYGPLKIRRIRNELGITCSTTELPWHIEPEAGFEPATTRVFMR